MYGDQAWSVYSKCGLMNVLYNVHEHSLIRISDIAIYE